MAFWTSKNAAPVQSHKFLVRMGGIAPFTVKSVTKPTIEYNEGAYQVGNHKFKYPGVHTWGDITLTLVDDKETTRRVMEQLLQQGLANPTLNKDLGGEAAGGPLFVPKQVNTDANATKGGISTMRIEQHTQFDPQIIQNVKYEQAPPSILETWILHDAFIKSVNFGQLDYSSDELISLEIVVAYDYCTINYGSPKSRAIVL